MTIGSLSNEKFASKIFCSDITLSTFLFKYLYHPSPSLSWMGSSEMRLICAVFLLKQRASSSSPP